MRFDPVITLGELIIIIGALLVYNQVQTLNLGSATISFGGTPPPR
jgi:hypothetical protein